MTEPEDRSARVEPGAPPPELASLFEEARADGPSERVLARGAARLAATLGNGGGGGGGGLRAHLPTAVALAALVVVLVVASVGGAPSGARLDSPETHVEESQRLGDLPPDPLVAPGPPESEPPVASPSPIPSAFVPPPPEPRAERTRRAATPAEAPVAEARPDETSLIDRARAAVRSSPVAALTLTDEHAHWFASGVLSEEREVIAIEALYRLGRGAEADARRGRFDASFPRSAYAVRLDRLRAEGATP